LVFFFFFFGGGGRLIVVNVRLVTDIANKEKGGTIK
jgi:hypothetical protein